MTEINAFPLQLENGEEVQTFEELQTLAEDGNSAAQLGLARCYKNGCGVEVDPDEAHKWYMKAAEGGVEYFGIAMRESSEIRNADLAELRELIEDLNNVRKEKKKGFWGALLDMADTAVGGVVKTGGELQMCVSAAMNFSDEEIRELLEGRGNIVMKYGSQGVSTDDANDHLMKLALQKVATDRGLI